MRPRPARGPARETAKAETTYRSFTFPGPSGGWVSDQNLSITQPSCAYRLENIFPTSTGGILRRGSAEHADITAASVVTPLSGTVDLLTGSPAVAGTSTAFMSELDDGDTIVVNGEIYVVASISDDENLTLDSNAVADATGATFSLSRASAGGAVKSIISYSPGGTNKLFAVTDEGIWDASISGIPSFLHPLTNGNISTAEYTTVDGVRYVRGVNGTDTPFVYDGSTISTSPPLTFKAPDDGLSPSILSYTWVYKNRYFFIERDSLNIWYLPVGNIGGELTKFSLGGEFTKGGRLVFGATWSIDAGSGLSSMCIFFTDQGECAVYAGSDPSEVNDWSRVGVYMIGRPRGPRSFVHRGGDLMISTDVGLVPLSSALQRDSATVALTAVSALIEDEWRDFIRERPGDWPMAVWTASQMLTIALPDSINGEPPIWLVLNVRTNRWCVFTGWHAVSTVVHGDRMFFGTPDGRVFEANVGATDDGRPYTGVYIPVFDQLGAGGFKVASMVRAVVRGLGEANVQLSCQSDFTVDLPPPPDATPSATGGDKWGQAKWGQAKWGSANSSVVLNQDWVHVAGDGEVISIAHQITSGDVLPIDTEFIRTDVLFTSGAIQS